jgi:hypothetical protein
MSKEEIQRAVQLMVEQARGIRVPSTWVTFVLKCLRREGFEPRATSVKRGVTTIQIPGEDLDRVEEILRRHRVPVWIEEQIEPDEIDWGPPMTPEEAYLYARDVLEGRFAEGESAIAQDAWYSYLYARYVLKGRFAEGEPAIARDAKYSKLYSRDILGGEPL